ncbi:HPr family phosphocarrier protein [Bifidobacterium psychraerophilum]|uniref:HPr family phosphocarrier protein n=1 Tax=Bifidobacterium psychraerophilum TaxID=218140 RepID=UPI0039EB77F5
MAKTFNFTVTDPAGIHARPAGQLVSKAQEYESAVTLTASDRSVDAKGILSVMGLGAQQGDVIEVSVSGSDEEAAAAALQQFFKESM